MTIKTLSSSLSRITGKFFDQKCFGRLGKICKLYSDEAILDALGQLGKIDNIITLTPNTAISYLQKFLSVKENKEEAKELLDNERLFLEW